MWNPFVRSIDPETRQLVPGALAFVTYGVKHIKFWQYTAEKDTICGSVHFRFLSCRFSKIPASRPDLYVVYWNG
jgi:hypothetical protein